MFQLPYYKLLSDLPNLRTGDYAADIKDEQEHVKWADIITFVYPVCLLKGKKAILFCTTGSPNDYYEKIGMHKSMKQTSDEGIFQFCGIDVIKHVFFGSVLISTDEERKKYLSEVEEVIRANC